MWSKVIDSLLIKSKIGASSLENVVEIPWKIKMENHDDKQYGT